MTERMYSVSPDGIAEPLDEQAYGLELTLQRLIAEHPELLAGEQLTPDEPRRLLLLAQEVGVSESVEAGSRWALDHLFVDQDAIPILVETKLATNPEIRRAVVGQMLDYAANAQYWDVQAIQDQFERSPDWERRLENLLESDGEVDVDEFWRKFATNLKGHRLRLLFVADEIPTALASIVTFLNEQTADTLQVLAIELKQFSGGTNRLFVPRVIGHVPASRATTKRTTTSREAFFEQFPSIAAREFAQRLLNDAIEAGASLEWGSRGVSIRGRSPARREPITVAWIYPTDWGWMRTRHFSFGTGIINYPDLDDPLRRALQDYTDGFAAIPGAESASSEGVIAWAFKPDDAVAQGDVLVAHVRRILTALRTLPVSAPPGD